MQTTRKSSKPWHSRRYLPHIDQPGLVQSIALRLHDAVPTIILMQWKEQADSSAEGRASLQNYVTHYEDSGYGACWLARAEIARMVEDSLLHFDAERYRLIAWCVMPNHVHAVIETLHEHPLEEIVRSWKRFTARSANRLLCRTGEFWMGDYFDRFVRDDRHLAATITYVENNPVKAGLIDRAEHWPFSSARCRMTGGE